MKKPTIQLLLFPIAALVAGFLIGKIDTSKNWDDTGITVLLTLGATFILSAFQSTRPWLFAILVATPIVVLNIYTSRNYGSVLAFAFAFIGAYIGFLVGRALQQ